MERRSRAYPPLRPTIVVEWTVTGANRGDLRCAVAQKWLEEQPYTAYRYNVEWCADGRRVYLLRPTWLNKGFDFEVHLEGFQSLLKSQKRMTERPSHDDVIHDLRTKVRARPTLIASIFEAVADVYVCADPLDILNRRPDVAGINVGLAADKVLYVIKWLFIEQDLTYWGHTGRDKLMSAIETQVFGLTL